MSNEARDSAAPAGLSRHELDDFKEAFHHHFRNTSSPVPNTITTKELRSIFDAMGHVATDKDISDLIDRHGSDVSTRNRRQSMAAHVAALAAPAATISARRASNVNGAGAVGGGFGRRQTMGGNNASAMQIIAALTTTKVLTWDQFIALMETKLRINDADGAVEHAFDVFDMKRVGYVLAKDLRLYMTQLGKTRVPEREVEMMIREADIDGDGTIDKSEFIKMLQK